ncbi:acyl-CoA dehydrogenase family protein [Mesorhizobium sp. BHbdii]
MADAGCAELATFRTEVKAWLQANFPARLANAPQAVFGAEDASDDASPDQVMWTERMGAKGWGTPTWPKEYGGGGLSRAQAQVLQEEMALVGAVNPIGGMGVSMLGPTLLEFGTEAQKQRHLPPICRGEIRWCQGYSEPGAGSDLASLQTRCEDAGDHWKVTGQKVWTSGAQYSDWCFCLVRTDRTKKHEGISFALINMHQPPVEVRPIKLISGASPFCEIFFTEARVERDDIVGPLNGGWAIGKRLLEHERHSQGGARMAGANGPSLVEIARRYVGVDEKGHLADPDLRARIVRHEIDQRAHVLTVARAAAESQGTANPSVAPSIMKNSSTWIGQERAELLIEILGHQGVGWAGEEFDKDELAAVRAWLATKATTIYGGSQEIQNNIVAKRILGLPDTIRR